MKRFLTITILLILFVLSACQIATTEKAEDTAQNISNSSGMEISLAPDPDKAVDYLHAYISESSMVVEGTLSSKERVSVEELVNQTKLQDIYTFENLNVITGLYNEESLPITVAVKKDADEKEPFQIGERYILIVQTRDSVNAQEEMRYMGSAVICKLSKENPDEIESVTADSFPIEALKGPKQALIDMVEEEVGLQNAYYHVNEQYVHSDIITDIVGGADVIAKIHIEAVDNEISYRLVEICNCTLLELYKGNIITLNENHFEMRPRINSTKEGEDYLVLLKTFSDSPRYYQAAKKNAIIPMSDTERVNEVYAALGIEPEE